MMINLKTIIQLRMVKVQFLFGILNLIRFGIKKFVQNQEKAQKRPPKKKQQNQPQKLELVNQKLVLNQLKIQLHQSLRLLTMKMMIWIWV